MKSQRDFPGAALRAGARALVASSRTGPLDGGRGGRSLRGTSASVANQVGPRSRGSAATRMLYLTVTTVHMPSL
jgi:hypothetical protein